MMFRKKNLLLSLAALCVITTTIYADTPSPSVCRGYLTASDKDFISLIGSSASTAQSVSTALSACQLNDSCSTLSDVDHCASILATREFESTYYAHLLAKNTSGREQNAETKLISVPVPTTPPSTTPAVSNNSSNTKTTNTSDNNSSSSIHWF